MMINDQKIRNEIRNHVLSLSDLVNDNSYAGFITGEVTEIEKRYVQGMILQAANAVTMALSPAEGHDYELCKDLQYQDYELYKDQLMK